MEEEKRDHDTKLKKMETEMEQVFEMKVKEKKQKLKDSEIVVSIFFLGIYLSSFFQWIFIKFTAATKERTNVEEIRIRSQWVRWKASTTRSRN